MNNEDLYAGKETDPIVINDLIEFFTDNYKEHMAIKQIVEIASNKPGLDTAVAKIRNKQKITSTELSAALKNELKKVLEFPVKDKKYQEVLNKLAKVASTQIATFISQSHQVTKKAFLKEMKKQGIVDTFEQGIASQEELEAILEREKISDIMRWFGIMKETERKYGIVKISAPAIGFLLLVRPEYIRLIRPEFTKQISPTMAECVVKLDLARKIFQD